MTTLIHIKLLCSTCLAVCLAGNSIVLYLASILEHQVWFALSKNTSSFLVQRVLYKVYLCICLCYILSKLCDKSNFHMLSYKFDYVLHIVSWIMNNFLFDQRKQLYYKPRIKFKIGNNWTFYLTYNRVEINFFGEKHTLTWLLLGNINKTIEYMGRVCFSHKSV